tara:strand:+ start:5440 stop:7233 length:1794 start_codon:yes stop_codon:yes gene_type:complete
MAKKNNPINYTNRDFESIKQSLVEYAKRYYPTNFKDFNESSFGSLMLDTVAYVGDMLSFYLDYQVNESFIDSAVDYDNVVRLARQLGYKLDKAYTSSGLVSFFLVVPAKTVGGGPDTDYMPKILKGSTVRSQNGSSFTLADDIDFSDDNNLVYPATIDSSTGRPLKYAVKATGNVVSGELAVKRISVGNFTRFLRLAVDDENTTEIISVYDASGRQYYEVESLTQDFVYRSVPNPGSDRQLVKELMKPVVVPRRFVVEKDDDNTFLQFGFGSESELDSDDVVDPSKINFNLYGKKYISDSTFDPTKLLSNSKLGIAPSDTTLTVTYRKNNTTDSNAPVGGIASPGKINYFFLAEESLDAFKLQEVRSSIEIYNEEPINGDIENLSADEIRVRALGAQASQGRAVTRQDYVNLCYRMPAKFGAIKRASIYQDQNSVKRNLNLYTISEDSDGNLTETNSTIKENLKTWIQGYKMLNDTIDILDAYVINLEIDFVVTGDRQFTPEQTLTDCLNALNEKFSVVPEIGEPFKVRDIYKVLNKLDSVLDVVDVKIGQKLGGQYSSNEYNIPINTSGDGSQILIPANMIYEIKFPNTNIKGEVR